MRQEARNGKRKHTTRIEMSAPVYRNDQTSSCLGPSVTNISGNEIKSSSLFRVKCYTGSIADVSHGRLVVEMLFLVLPTGDRGDWD